MCLLDLVCITVGASTDSPPAATWRPGARGSSEASKYKDEAHVPGRLPTERYDSWTHTFGLALTLPVHEPCHRRAANSTTNATLGSVSDPYISGRGSPLGGRSTVLTPQVYADRRRQFTLDPMQQHSTRPGSSSGTQPFPCSSMLRSCRECHLGAPLDILIGLWSRQANVSDRPVSLHESPHGSFAAVRTLVNETGKFYPYPLYGQSLWTHPRALYTILAD
ncbi:hypothetical protein C8Q77DRAFT_92034 [Trametes polyzona]|nr:hypothetical protein C8Q77DRAFT_92034 [Trametes polyzona]